MTSKIKKGILLAVCACLLTGLVCQAGNPARASKFVGVIMDESFTDDEFSSDNWRLAEELDDNGDPINRNIYVQTSDPFLVLRGGTYDLGTAVYIDVAAQVADNTGKLIVEYDLINPVNYASMFSVVTGMEKDADGRMVLSQERRSQMIMCGPGGNALTSWGYGLPGFSGPTEFTVAYNSTNYGASSPLGGYGTIGYRYRLVYDQNGSFASYRYLRNADGSYGAEEACVYVSEGMLQNEHSGYIGFFFWAETTGIHLSNVRIATQQNEQAQEVEVFADTGKADVLKEEWKVINGNNQVSLSRLPGKAVFDNPSDSNYLTSAGSKDIPYDAVYDAYITMTFTLKIRQLQGMRAFGLAFGLYTSADNTQTEGVSYLSFRRNSSDGNKVDLGWSKQVDGSAVLSNIVTVNASTFIGKDLNIEIVPFVNGKVNVTVNNTVYAFAIPKQKIILDKRLAFIATGGNLANGDSVRADLSDVKITNRYDQVPDDIVDLRQGFDGVDQNGNPWYDRSLYSFGGGLGYVHGNLDAGVFIEGGKLVFRNAGHNSYFSPTKAFGDFMMQFDITDMAREDLYTQNGQVFRPFMRSWLGITFGLPSAGSPYPSGYLLYMTPTYEVDPADATKFRPSAAPSPFTLLGPNEVPLLSGTLRHNLIDPTLDGKDIVVRLKADGGVLTFAYYVRGEESMEMLDKPVFTYNNNGLGFGHNGYLGITCTSAGEHLIAGDFSIDNFVLTSLDRNVNIGNDPDKPVEQEPEEPPVTPPEEEEKGCGSAVNFVWIIAVGVAVLAIAKHSASVKNRSGKQ